MSMNCQWILLSNTTNLEHRETPRKQVASETMTLSEKMTSQATG